MADATLASLPDGAPAQMTDELYIYRADVTGDYRVTVQDVRTPLIGITGTGVIDNSFGLGYITSLAQIDSGVYYGAVYLGAGANDCGLTQEYAKTRSTDGNANVIVQASDELGHFSFRGDNGAGLELGAEIIVTVDGTPSATSMPGRIGFGTTPAGTLISVERMAIDNAGHIIIANIPTSAAGLTAGMLWSDGGTIKIV
jgi:hypothetical protein